MSCICKIAPGLPQTPHPCDLFTSSYSANFHIKDICSKISLNSPSMQIHFAVPPTPPAPAQKHIRGSERGRRGSKVIKTVHP